MLVGSSATDLSILGNVIHSNLEQGIDLIASGFPSSGDAVTANDSGDGDTGGNGLQNYPLLTSAAAGGQTEISGSLDSADGSYRLEFFSNPSCDTANGNGEGRTYLGSTDVTVSGGATNFAATLPTAATVGHVVTATATGPTGSTSEFSACRAVSSGTAATGTIVVVKDAQPDDGQDFSFTAGGGLSPTSFVLDDDADSGLSNQQSFTVAPGSGFSVAEQATSGWTLSSATCSDGSPVSNISVSANETVTCTFVNTPPVNGTVSGFKLNDLNNDNTVDSGEPRVPGWWVHAYVDADDDDSLDADEIGSAVSAQTDATGTYSLSLPPGEYLVCEATQAGWQQSPPDNVPGIGGPTVCAADSSVYPAGYTVSLGSGQQLTRRLRQPPAGRAVRPGLRQRDR